MMGLDVEAVQVLKELMKSRAACGKSVLFSSHILEICENLCDKIVIMQAVVHIRYKIQIFLSRKIVVYIVAVRNIADLFLM